MEKKEAKKTKAKIVLFGFSFSIMVFIFLWLMKPDSIKWFFVDSSNWSTTTGKITSSSISDLIGSPAFNAVGWHFMIKYEYKVNDKSYISDRVNYSSTGSSNIEFAKSYVAKYPLGKSVLVYYDPAHPEKSVLEPNVKDFEVIYLLAGCLLSGVFVSSLSFLSEILNKNQFSLPKHPLASSTPT